MEKTENRHLVRVVDDDEDVRASIRFMLECEGWETAAFDSAEAFLSGDVPSRIGCLVLDVRMPGKSGLELQRELALRRFRLPVIFLTGHGTIGMAVSAMREGAVTFLQKPVNPQELLPAVARAVEQDRRRRGQLSERGAQALLAQLTPREREILELAARGLVNRDIAETLGLSKRTVEHYRATALKKLKAGTVAEAACLFSEQQP